MKKLNTFVHVDGVAYGPDDKVPAEVAKRITAPGVWDESGTPENEQPPSVQQRPENDADKDLWVEFAVAQGLDRGQSEKLTREQLVERFPVEPVVGVDPTPPVVDETPAGTEKAPGRSGGARR